MTTSTRTGRLRSLVTATVLVVAALGAPTHATASPTSAATELLSCPGYQTVSWNPGLLLAERTVRTSGATVMGPCVDPEGEITSGTSTFSYDKTTGCLTALEQAPGSETITWNTNEQTTFSWTTSELTSTIVAGALVVTVRTDIESGRYAGNTMLYVVTSASLNLTGCLSEPGVTGASGPIVVTILP